jgi:hypothetical protein
VYHDVDRSKIVFHELREALLRTAFGYSYSKAHRQAGGIGKTTTFYPNK